MKFMNTSINGLARMVIPRDENAIICRGVPTIDTRAVKFDLMPMTNM